MDDRSKFFTRWSEKILGDSVKTPPRGRLKKGSKGIYTRRLFYMKKTEEHQQNKTLLKDVREKAQQQSASCHGGQRAPAIPAFCSHTNTLLRDTLWMPHIHSELIRMIPAYPLPATFYSDPRLCKARPHRSLWLAILNTRTTICFGIQGAGPSWLHFSLSGAFPEHPDIFLPSLIRVV